MTPEKQPILQPGACIERRMVSALCICGLRRSFEFYPGANGQFPEASVVLHDRGWRLHGLMQGHSKVPMWTCPKCDSDVRRLAQQEPGAAQ